LLSKLVGVGGALEGHSSLSDIYIQELRDVWSALDQMGESLTLFQKKSMDARLLELLSKSRELAFLLGELVEKCLRSSNGQLSKKRCHGMEGISYEVQQNLTRNAETDALQIVAILSQFQKITQYVRAGWKPQDHLLKSSANMSLTRIWEKGSTRCSSWKSALMILFLMHLVHRNSWLEQTK
jgi:ferritin-like metal-binding protein YciE